MITVSTYLSSVSASAASNAVMVDLGCVQLYFSYKTLVAIKMPNYKLAVIKNYWGPTTGKHLNAIDGGTVEAKKERLNDDEFKKIAEQFSTEFKKTMSDFAFKL